MRFCKDVGIISRVPRTSTLLLWSMVISSFNILKGFTLELFQDPDLRACCKAIRDSSVAVALLMS